jgi:MbtH protein
MNTSEDVDQKTYRVVVNHEEQYSIWPAGKDLPGGWNEAGFDGPKQVCLEHIDAVWTDMRPLSVRRAMQGGKP